MFVLGDKHQFANVTVVLPLCNSSVTVVSLMRHRVAIVHVLSYEFDTVKYLLILCFIILLFENLSSRLSKAKYDAGIVNVYEKMTQSFPPKTQVFHLKSLFNNSIIQ